jgi:hypothetical protein
MDFLNRCNGSHSPKPRLSEAAFKVFCAHKEKARKDFLFLAAECKAKRNCYGDYPFTYEGRDYYLGYRFLDDNTVMDRIESAITDEAEFLANPYAWCLDALRDCAGADHWYTFEKDWG